MEKKSVVQFKVRTDLRAGATFPDMSGVCSGAGIRPPEGGVWPDMSGYCEGKQPPITSEPNFPDMSGYCA